MVMKAGSEIHKQVFEQLGVEINTFKKMSVCVFPEFLISDEPPSYLLSKIASALGLEPEPYSPWKKYDLCICLEDATTCSVDVEAYIRRSSKLWAYDEK